MNLPKLTKKQKEILGLLYKHRFLNRVQIQAFLQHKDYKTINAWLKDLREKQYVEWIYSTDFAEKTKPGIYYLGLNGVRYLKTLETYPLDELRKRYRESSRSQTYIDRCLLLADCCITLETKHGENVYYYELESEYFTEESFYHFITESVLIHPQLCVSKSKFDPHQNEDVDVNHYLLEVFDATLPRYRMKKRLSDYAKYLDEEEYEWKQEAETDKLPVILLVCPRTTDLIYAKRRTRSLIAETWEYKDEDEERPCIRFTTVEKLRAHGATGDIWEEA